MLRELLTNESGQGMVEYALIIAFIAIVVIRAVGIFGTALSQKYDDIVNHLQPLSKE
jgi:pilus assembly protein Flp/PilA